MFQKKMLGVLFVSAFVFVSVAYAGKVELTTYYPAPFGEYQELNSAGETHLATGGGANVGIGTTTPTTKLDVAGDVHATGNASFAGVGVPNLPNRGGDIRLTSQAGDPTNNAAWPVGPEGQVAYSADNDALYVSDGATWRASVGGTAVTGLYGVCTEHTNPPPLAATICMNAHAPALCNPGPWSSLCLCPSGFTKIKMGYDGNPGGGQDRFFSCYKN